MSRHYHNYYDEEAPKYSSELIDASEAKRRASTNLGMKAKRKLTEITAKIHEAVNQNKFAVTVDRISVLDEGKIVREQLILKGYKLSDYDLDQRSDPRERATTTISWS